MRPVAGSNVYLILKHRRMQDEETCCTSGVRQTFSLMCTEIFILRKNNSHIYQLAKCLI